MFYDVKYVHRKEKLSQGLVYHFSRVKSCENVDSHLLRAIVVFEFYVWPT